MLQLWHCENARSFRALWALEELGLDYELTMLAFPPRAHDKSYFAENPLGTIPLLVDGETRMTESSAIAHYLATRHGGGRFAVAVDHPEYGAYLNWLHHGEATLTFPQTLVLRYGFLEPPERRLPQAAEDYAAWFLGRLKLLEQTLEDGREYLLESGFSMADVSVGYAIQLALAIRLRDRLPPLSLAWFERLAARPAHRRAREKEQAARDAAGIPPLRF